MRSDNPHFVRASPKQIFFSLKFKTYYCSSSFLICIVFCLTKVIHSQEYPSTAVLKILKMHWNLLFWPFFCDFSPENLSRTSCKIYRFSVLLNWKFYREYLLMKNYKVDMLFWVPSQQIFWVLAPIHVLLN